MNRCGEEGVGVRTCPLPLAPQTKGGGECRRLDAIDKEGGREMRVYRIITFKGSLENLLTQLKNSGPDGVYKLPNGLSISIETVVDVKDRVAPTKELLEAITHVPPQWPVQWGVEDGPE